MVDYKKEILEALTRLEKSGINCKAQRELVEKETNPRRLFLLHQTLREVLAAESSTTAEFEYRRQDGTVAKAQSLDDAFKDLK